jgi:hypothetical protein
MQKAEFNKSSPGSTCVSNIPCSESPLSLSLSTHALGFGDRWFGNGLGCLGLLTKLLRNQEPKLIVEELQTRYVSVTKKIRLGMVRYSPTFLRSSGTCIMSNLAKSMILILSRQQKQQVMIGKINCPVQYSTSILFSLKYIARVQTAIKK